MTKSIVNKILKEVITNYSLGDKVESLLLSGGKKKFTFSNEDLVELKKTVKQTNYVLYRGMGLIRREGHEKYYDAINQLKVGDKLPDFLKKNNFSNDIVSYSKKLSVARSRQYSEGTISIIFKVETGPENIICDLENIKVLNLDLDEDIDDYLKKEKEVFVSETNVTPIIIFIKGKYR